MPDDLVQGMAFFKKAKVYLPAVGSNEAAASTAIHEGIHMLGVRGTGRAEALARIGELMHQGQQINRASMKNVLKEMKASGAYGELKWKRGFTSPYFPGIKF